VSRHDCARGDRRFLPIAEDVRERRRHLPQCFESALRTVLLDETEKDGKKHDDGDDHSFESVSKQTRYQCGGQEDDNENILELGSERVPRRCAFEGLKFIRPMKLEPTCGFTTVKAVGAGVKLG
jgi:hypothetical protein